MKKKEKIIMLFFSAVALLNVMFVPIFDVWGGLFPNDVKRDFFDVIDIIVEDGQEGWQLWVVQLTMIIFIPSICMFVMAFVGSKKGFIIACCVGVIVWTMKIYEYMQKNDGIEELLDFEDGNISIGTWMAFLIYGSALVILGLLQSEEKKDTNQKVIICKEN